METTNTWANVLEVEYKEVELVCFVYPLLRLGIP